MRRFNHIQPNQLYGIKAASKRNVSLSAEEFLRNTQLGTLLDWSEVELQSLKGSKWRMVSQALKQERMERWSGGGMRRYSFFFFFFGGGWDSDIR